jgi:hypothetical protein
MPKKPWPCDATRAVSTADNRVRHQPQLTFPEAKPEMHDAGRKNMPQLQGAGIGG